MKGVVYCSNCGAVGEAKTWTKGYFIVELLLWLAFLLPGLIYSTWRLVSRYRGCSVCRSPAVMPADAPKAQEALARRR